MGYQNNDRPDNFDDLLLDLSFDISYIQYDHDRAPTQKDMWHIKKSLEFIKETINLIIKKQRGRNKRAKTLKNKIKNYKS